MSNVNEIPTNYIKIEELKAGFRNVNLVAKIIDSREPRVIISRNDRSEHRVGEALMGDEKGVVLLTLWDRQLEVFVPNEVFEIKNGYTSLFKGSLRLNLGRQGRYQRIDKEIDNIGSNNLSKEMHSTGWTTQSSRPFRRRRRRY